MDSYDASGIASGFNQGATNFINAFSAVRQLRQKKEMHDIDMKKGELDIKKLELAVGPEAIEKEREIFKLTKRKYDAEYKLALARTTNEARKVHQNALKARRDAQDYSRKQRQLGEGDQIISDAYQNPETRKRVGVSTGGVPYLSPENKAANDLLSLLGGAGGAGSATVQDELEDPSAFTEGTVAKAPSGKRYKVVGGKWTPYNGA